MLHLGEVVRPAAYGRLVCIVAWVARRIFAAVLLTDEQYEQLIAHIEGVMARADNDELSSEDKDAA